MASYYNKTSAPITVSLKNGDSAMIPPRKKLSVTVDQDGSPSLHAMVRRGFLVKLATPKRMMMKAQSVPGPTFTCIPIKTKKIGAKTPNIKS